MKEEQKNELFPLVVKEAKNLRKFATTDELSKLDTATLVDTSSNCFYGKMTGDCYSRRAGELIRCCCGKVYRASSTGTIKENAPLNGSPVGLKRTRDNDFDIICEFYSPMEMLLSIEDSEKGVSAENNTFSPESNVGRIVAFLKGETDEIIME